MRHRPSPSVEQDHRSDDLFRARLDQIIRSDHPLVRLADAMPWESIVEQVAELLPPTPEGAGRASLPERIMVGLLYLKYAYNLSDDQAIERWLESPNIGWLVRWLLTFWRWILSAALRLLDDAGTHARSNVALAAA